MAFFTDTQMNDAGLSERFAQGLSTWFAHLAERQAQRRIARTTFRELSSLSNRELADLGMSRSEIRHIAFSASQNTL